MRVFILSDKGNFDRNLLKLFKKGKVNSNYIKKEKLTHII